MGKGLELINMGGCGHVDFPRGKMARSQSWSLLQKRLSLLLNQPMPGMALESHQLFWKKSVHCMWIARQRLQRLEKQNRMLKTALQNLQLTAKRKVKEQRMERQSFISHSMQQAQRLAERDARIQDLKDCVNLFFMSYKRME